MDDATTRETCELFSSTDMLTKCPRMWFFSLRKVDC
jgi:hypothetical protein